MLCEGKNEVIVEYALRDSTKPMGAAAEYRLSAALPHHCEGSYRPKQSLHGNSVNVASKVPQRGRTPRVRAENRRPISRRASHDEQSSAWPGRRSRGRIS
ncbi:hypothetical protein LAC81_35400 (plasmid) [Ensifer adhaerens]|uniref:hypothetical protein n=1 Tax=Ensifer adhaerens TaxID=106592 RepID=UPI001F2611D0|nr:hypothetical protein [Ensifer adhaerens]UAX98257.1 hypothetical protein LAC78_36700 [Ensifer adhaerens]UAY05639.1 hypothetical protein LAC80_35405 [Ensifer adhaerens]UAY13017.1 hypothetical protein LAC81_35400 [Ensifer adhaerens]